MSRKKILKVLIELEEALIEADANIIKDYDRRKSEAIAICINQGEEPYNLTKGIPYRQAWEKHLEKGKPPLTKIDILKQLIKENIE